MPQLIHRFLWRAVVVVTAASLAFAAIAAIARSAQRLGGLQADAAFAAGGLLLAGLAVVVHRKFLSRLPDRGFLLALTLGTLLLRASLPILIPHYEQLADRLFFQKFVEAVVQGGGDDSAYAALSGQHDYPLWSGRSWPQHLWLRQWLGDRHVSGQQLLNVLLSVLLIPLSFAIGRGIGGSGTARLAAWLLALSPLHSFMVLDYTYQFQGAVLVTLVVAIAMRLAAAETWSLARLAREGAALSLILFLLNLQRGLDLLAMAVLGAALLPMLFAGRLAACARIAVLGILLPAAVARVAVAPINAQFERADRHHLYSHAIAQAGIGLNLVTTGEFLGRFVQIDELTPDAGGAAFLKHLAISELRDAPLETAFVLPVTKLVKYLQIGAASGIEEGLAAGGHGRAESAFRGLRLVYAPVLLALAAAGAWTLMRRTPGRSAWVLLCTLAGCFAIYAFLNQTSPRYSVYVQPALAILAASALARKPVGAQETCEPFRPFAVTGLALALLYAVTAGAGALLCRGPLASRGFLALEPEAAGWKLGPRADGLWVAPLDHATGTGGTAVFRRMVTMPDPRGAVELSGCLWPDRFRVEAVEVLRDGRHLQVEWSSLASGVTRIVVQVPEPCVSAEVELQVEGTPLPGGQPAAIEAGYFAVGSAPAGGFSPTAKIETPQGKPAARSQ